MDEGYPFIFGIRLYSSFSSATVFFTGKVPVPNMQTEQLLGGHAICIVGYDDTLPVAGRANGRFICRNSWGTGWGDAGYFYMPYDVIKTTSMSSDFWLISAVNNPA